MKKFLFISGLMFFYIHITAQGDFFEDEKILFKNEKSTSFLISSNGFGFDYLFSDRINASRKTNYKIKLFVLKDPKEFKLSNIYANNGNSFVFGKLNTFISSDFLYGRQKEIFKKQDKGSISIRYYYNGGVTIGLQKPIYYTVIEAISPEYAILHTQKFNDNIHGPEDIYSREPFFKGLNEISINPGITGEFGFSFEFSNREKRINSIDAGISLNSYLLKVPIMANETSNQIFISIFAAYRFGFVSDIAFKE